MVSVATKEQASTISKHLVANRLAACVQITKIHSVYVWDGECQEDDEFLLLIKTEKASFQRSKRQCSASTTMMFQK
jgi:divalent-cation tolerance protein cutA